MSVNRMFITPVFLSWLHSLTIFYPRAFVSLIQRAYGSFTSALRATVILFWWLLLAIIPLMLISHQYFGATLNDSVKATQVELIALLMLSVILLIINASMVLFTRSRSDQLMPNDYFKVYFLWYMRLYMAFLLCSILFILCLMALGITTLPSQAIANIPGMQLLGMVTVFYWLDSRFRLKDIFLAFERAVNLILYNLPFFCVIGALSYGLSVLLNGLCVYISSIPYVCMSGALIKCLLIMGQWFIINLVYNFYKQKKHKNYTESIVE